MERPFDVNLTFILLSATPILLIALHTNTTKILNYSSPLSLPLLQRKKKMKTWKNLV